MAGWRGEPRVRLQGPEDPEQWGVGHKKAGFREPAFSCNGGGSQPGTQLSLVSEAAIARPSELLREVFLADRKGVVTLLSSLRRRDRADQGMAKASLHPLPGFKDCHSQALAFMVFPERGAKM